MEWLQHYSYFLACTVTLLLAIIALFAILGMLKQRAQSEKGELKIKKLDEYYDNLSKQLQQELLDKKTLKKHSKQKKSAKKKLGKTHNKKRCFVIRFHGDIRASQVDALTECINAILLIATTKDEVLVILESAGGVVHGYGLAASQLERITQAKLKLVIAIDKIAASGGYMMASVADHIVAAPFAIIGSIGVVMQMPNFHRYLQDKHIDVELLTAGQYKRTLTMLGKNTEEGREKMQADIDETHLLFKQHIQHTRPEVDIESVATGEHWHAIQAKSLKLVDEILTSDDYLLSKRKHFHLVEIEYRMKKNLGQRLQMAFDTALAPLQSLNHKG